MRSYEDLNKIVEKIQSQLVDEGLTLAEMSIIIDELYIRHLIARTAQVVEDRKAMAEKWFKKEG